MSKIAVIIVTFNGAKWIEKCILSILESTVCCKIFAIDSASTDETIAILQKFENIEIIKNETNLGFGKANNIGIKKAKHGGFEQFFLLNQDTWIEKNTMEILSDILQKNQEFGILSPMHLATNEIDLDKNFETYYFFLYSI